MDGVCEIYSPQMVAFDFQGYKMTTICRHILHLRNLLNDQQENERYEALKVFPQIICGRERESYFYVPTLILLRLFHR